MESLKNTNTLIKIEPSSGLDRMNDGGFESLLDEFGPENDCQSMSMNTDTFCEDITNPSKTSTDEVHSHQVNIVNKETAPDLNSSANIDAQETNIPTTTIETTASANTSCESILTKQTNMFSTECSNLRIDMKKKRKRRLKRSLARAAALIYANSDFNKRLIPFTITNDLPSDPNPIIGHCEVLIFSNNHPQMDLNREQFIIVQQKFIQAIMEDSSLHVDNWCPRFIDCKFKDGAIYFICADITTRHWIIATLPKLNFWPNANLIAIDTANLLKLTKITVWVDSCITLETPQILSLLEKQNEGLSTSKWVIYYRNKPALKGIELMIGIDEESLKLLRDIGGKPYLGLGQAEFILPEKPEKLVNNVEAPQDKRLTNNNAVCHTKSNSTSQIKSINSNNTMTALLQKHPPFVPNLINPRPMDVTAGPNINVRPMNGPFSSVARSSLLQPRDFTLGYSRINSNHRYSPSSPWKN